MGKISRKQTERKSVYEVVTSRIVEQLEKGVVPWQHPWCGDYQPPRNTISGKPYRGINTLVLGFSGYQSPYFLTFKQAKDLGGNVRKGEKGLPVVYWNTIDRETETTDGESKTEHIPFIRYSTVFNVCQCELPENKVPVDKIERRDFEPIGEAERIVNDWQGKPTVEHGYRQAAYVPMDDKVIMPDADTFVSAERYYGVLFHELVHSTGHESRLNRQHSTKRREFGSADYSREELVAEIGAAFLCGASRIETTVEQSAAYCEAWIRALKGDAKLVVQAASAAQKAADMILGD